MSFHLLIPTGGEVVLYLWYLPHPHLLSLGERGEWVRAKEDI